MCYFCHSNSLIIVHGACNWEKIEQKIKAKERGYNDKASTFQLIISFKKVECTYNQYDRKIAYICNIEHFTYYWMSEVFGK